jgi:hypothetical protein
MSEEGQTREVEMKSPFPGMDPYLEDPAFWPDFHHKFIDDLSDALAALLPDAYEARVDESVNLVQMTPEVIKLIYPDVAVSRAPRAARPSPGSAATLLLEPVTIPNQFLEEVRDAHIEILHRPERSLVAVIELLSPFNKRDDGYEQYRAKRNALLGQKVHLVELDLLLGGDRVSLLNPLPEAAYYAFLTRAEDRANCHVFGWGLRQPLPTIPVPLRAPDPDMHVNLQQVFEATFTRGRYSRSLRYGQPPKASMIESDARWAVELSSKR